MSIKMSRIASLQDYVKIFEISERTAQRWYNSDKKRASLNGCRLTLRWLADVNCLLAEDIIQAVKTR